MFVWDVFPCRYLADLLQDWLELEEAVEAGPVSGFGRRLSSVLDKYLSELVHICSDMLLLRFTLFIVDNL